MSGYVIKVFGIPESLSAFNELPLRIRNKHLRIALNAAGGVIRDTAASIVRRESGLLAKSLRVRVKIPSASFNLKHHDKPAYAVIGSSRNVVGPVVSGKLLSTRKATKLVVGGGSVQTRRSSRYAHLLEKGHGGPHPAPAYPFLSVAVSQSKSAALAKAVLKLQQGIAQEVPLIYRMFASPVALTA